MRRGVGRLGTRQFMIAALAWTTFVVYGSLVPLRYHHVEFADAVDQFRHLPPLWVGLGTRADWVANILLFIPLTFLWMGALTVDRGRISRWAASACLIPLSVVAAIGLEFTQIWFIGRTVSRNDILAESIGGCAGVLAWWWFGQSSTQWARAFLADRQPRSGLRGLLELYMVGFLIYSVIPLDLTISLTDLYEKYRRGNVLLVPFAYSYDASLTVVYQFFADVATFVPVGAWIAIVRPTYLRSWPPLLRGLTGGAVMAACLEAAQLLVLSRYTDTTDIVLGAVGAALGCWLTARFVAHAPDSDRTDGQGARSGASFWLLGLAIYSVFLAVGFLYPFNITHDRDVIRRGYEQFFRVPFFALYQGTEYNAITQLLIRVLLFAPVGIAIGRLADFAPTRFGQKVVAVVGVAYAIVLATALELAQILMPPKVADSTEVLLCMGGAGLGLWIVRRLTGQLGPERRARR